jgi:hypothetical protein
MLTIVMVIAFSMLAGADASAANSTCTSAATQGMKGTGQYTSNPTLIGSVVKNPSAPAYVLFRLTFGSPTCPAVKYEVIAVDAATGTLVGIDLSKGPGTFSPGLGAYVLEFQLPITSFNSTTNTPSGVCVSDRVVFDETVLHQGPSGGCLTPAGIQTWPGMYLELNPTGGGGGEFDM